MNRNSLWLLAMAVSASCAVAQQPGAASSNAAEGLRADSHFHLLDFLQNGEFLNTDGRFPGTEWGVTEGGRYSTLPYGERGRRIEAVLRGMAEARVGHLMVSGMPFLKKWSENEPFLRPRYYLDSSSRVKWARDTDIAVASAIVDYQAMHADDPARLAELAKIHPFITGFDATDLGGVDLIVKRIKEFPGVWEGIGEAMSRHDDLTNLTMGERPRANHPALVRVCRFAGEHFLPVSIHHNIAPISRNPSEVKPPMYLDEFVELLRQCRWEEDGVSHMARFIWCHAGISRRVTIADLPFWIEEVLKEAGEQIYIDLSWVVLEDYIYPDLERWVGLISRFPDRFMIGSDAVGRASAIGTELDRFDRLLAELPANVRTQVAHDNFSGLMAEMASARATAGLGEKGIVLDERYEFPEFAHTGRLPTAESFTASHDQRADTD